MPVSDRDVLHVAALARLRLTPEEVERLTVQLNDILAHVAVLAEAGDTAAEAEPAAEGPARLRPDGSAPDGLALPPESLAPEWQDGFFTLPRLDAMEAP